MPYSRTLGPLSPPAWHRPWFRYFAPVEGEGAPPAGETPPASDPASSAQTPPADPPADTTDWKSEARKWEQRAKDNKEKADKFDTAEQEKLSEIEKERLRADTAEQKSAASGAELRQLQAAIENGITKDERALLTGSTDEELKAQVAAILKLRAPSAASAQDAGITGGGKAPVQKPTSMEAAFAAHYAAGGK